MRSWMKTALATAISVVVLAGVLGLLVIYTGAYNVAATQEHWGATEWALGTLQHRSVEARADAVQGSVPTDAEALAHGFEHFHAMCVQCHGAPGFERGELGQGMRPTPPPLEEEAHEWSDQEIFWITKHGMRLAGMPAFGATHSDDEIWAITGFVRELETMTEEEYARRVEAMREAAGGEGAGGDAHSHAPGTPDHQH